MSARVIESPPATTPRFQWGVKIPLRDGVHLNATLYSPVDEQPSPAIVTLTPYVGQTYHDQALYFASHGYSFLAVDARGRGNSDGAFRPNINEAKDGHDVVEWVARQPFCNGKVAMWGGSYAGYDQWATAKELPAHLSSIVPAAAPYMAVDFPIRNNIAYAYLVQWLTFVAGRALQDRIFSDHSYWRCRFKEWFVSGAPFRDLDRFVGTPSETFQEWLSHPRPDEYWDSYNPTSEEYARMSLPVLTITGIYDGDQLGALTHYREHLKHCQQAVHFLLIGPWDHAGTRTPMQEFCGLRVGPESLLDLRELHLRWYDWTLRGRQRPEFLRKRVAYYVMVSDRWRYADSLEQITAHTQTLYLHATESPTDVFRSGSLLKGAPLPGARCEPSCYVYDPRDVSLAELESSVDPESRVDQRLIHAAAGKQLICHSAPFEADMEISGFFRLSAWLAIDQPDTDFRVSLYDVALGGEAVQLTCDWIRARYRRGLREQKLITTQAPLRYEFERFPFTSRLIRKGHRLRLVLGPINSIYSQKNYNSGGEVSDESMADARPVVVRLFHDAAHPSALHVPVGAQGDEH